MFRHYDVITIGETTMDAFMTLHDSSAKVSLSDGELCFRHGEKINVEQYDFAMGGNATNVAVGLSRLGVKATLATEIGDDEFSIKIRNWLAMEHIERLLMVQTSGATNFSVIINFKSDRTIFVQNIARKHEFQFDEVETNCVYLTSLGEEWEHAYQHAVAFSRKQKALLVFNPGHKQVQSGSEVIKDVLSTTDILFVNKEEAEQLLFHHYGEKDDDSEGYMQRLATRLQKKGVKIVVITNGREGSFALDDTGEFHHKGMHPGKRVERTGVGDAFASGFLAARLQRVAIPVAMEWGSINAASVAAHVGAEAGLLTREEIERIVNA